MSRVVAVRGLPGPGVLAAREREELLRQSGAERVEHAGRDALAVFPSHEAARAGLARLRRLQLGGRTLQAEYWQGPAGREAPSLAARQVQRFLERLGSWHAELDFHAPPPPTLRYKYPAPSGATLLNILYAIAHNEKLYTQVLHLMNKMSLDPPFGSDERAVSYFKKIFQTYFVEREPEDPVSSSETEMSSADEKKIESQVAPKIRKRVHVLPVRRKRPVAMVNMGIVPMTKKKKMPDQAQIFEEVCLHEPKKITLVVSQDSLNRQQVCDTQVIGEIKKLHKEPSTQDEAIELTNITSENEDHTRTISKQQLLKNRISVSDMKILPVFKNYHPGEPSMRLYLKNLAKNVKEDVIKKIYGRYVENLPSSDQQGFDVRVMQEGRMKGQGFVTFPSVSIAEVALNETNGYILNDKPMVVQFARISNKKPID